MATIESAGPLTKEELIEQSKRVVRKVGPLLANQPGEVVGAVLLNLMGGYLSAYRPDLRDSLLAAWLNGLPDMVKACDKIRFADREAPKQLDS